MWNLFKKSPAEEESLKLSQIQAQLEEAKKDLDSINATIKDNLYTLKTILIISQSSDYLLCLAIIHSQDL